MKKIVLLVLIGLVLSGCAVRQRLGMSYMDSSCIELNKPDECMNMAKYIINRYNKINPSYDYTMVAVNYAAHGCILGSKKSCDMSRAIFQDKEIKYDEINGHIIEGFRDIYWGDSVEGLGEYEILSKVDNRTNDIFVIKINDDLMIDGVQVSKITYRFFNDMFYSLLIEVEDKKSLEELYKIFESKYGAFQTSENSQNVSIKTQNTLIEKQQNIEKNVYILHIYNIELSSVQFLQQSKIFSKDRLNK